MRRATSPPASDRGTTSFLPRLRDRDVLLLAVAVGLVAGLAEAIATVLGYTVGHRASGAIVWGEVYWMAPLAACTLLLFLALAILALRRLPRSDALAGLAPFLFVALATYGFGRSLELGIDPRALMILAAGFAAAVTRGITRRTSSVLRWTRRLTAAGAIGLITWAGWVPEARNLDRRRAVRDLPAPSVQGPDIVLIVWDTVRAASLSLYGYGRQTTPNLERLGEDAVVFERAIAPSSWTLPSHASLFTARYPHEHLADREVPLDDRFPTLAEVLSDRGYETGGFVANLHWLGSAFGLDRGFQRWEDEWWSPSADQVLGSWWITRRLQVRFRARMGRGRAAIRIDAGRVQGAFLDWVDRRDRDRPFFAFLNLFDAHDPYDPPGGHRFADADARYWWNYQVPDTLSASELAELRDTYDGCLHYLDRQLGRLMDELEARGLLDETLIILTADHGETLGENDPMVLGHSTSMYFDVLNVPLVVRYPAEFAPARRGETVSLVDLPATVMEVVTGSDAEHPFTGHSLVPLLAGRPGSPASAASPAYSHANPADFHLPHDVWPISKGPLHSLVANGRHYIRNAVGDETLFDVDAGLPERDDLSGTTEGAAVLADYRARVDELLRSRSTGAGR